MKYRKKPVVIEAIQFKDDLDVLVEIQNFMGDPNSGYLTRTHRTR